MAEGRGLYACERGAGWRWAGVGRAADVAPASTSRAGNATPAAHATRTQRTARRPTRTP